MKRLSCLWVLRHYTGATSSTLRATVVTEQTYDHRDRPVDTWKTLGTGTRTLIARNTYNEVGQLWKKGLHSTNGTSFAEPATYAYNSRGWLLRTISPKFTQTLNYDSLMAGVARQYNGNISRQG